MNQRLLITLIILAGIGSIGSVLAYSGTISAGQGNFNNVLVTGTCTGCGGEGSFTTYTTFFNNTLPSSSHFPIVNLKVANDGSLLAYDNINNETVISSSQVVIGTASDFSTAVGPYQYGMSSSTGEYKFIFDSTANSIQIFKNNSLLQTITINNTQFFGSNLGSASFAISPNGQYIGIYGKDVSGSFERLVLLKGA